MVLQFRLFVRLYVRPSVTRVDFIKTAEHIIKILSLSDRPIIQVFRHKSDGSTLTGAPNTRGQGGSDFRPICGYISETVIDRGIFTKTNIKSYVLYHIMPLSMTLGDPEPQFQGHSIV